MRRQVRIGSAKRERARRCEVNHAAGDCCVRAKRANFINDFNLYPLAQPGLTRSTCTHSLNLYSPCTHSRLVPLPPTPARRSFPLAPVISNPSLAPSTATGPRTNALSWDDYFLSVAFLSAHRSKDPSTQVGACIVNEDNRIIGIGYNGFPAGCR